MYLPGTHTFMIECLLSFFLEICLYFSREKFYTYFLLKQFSFHYENAPEISGAFLLSSWCNSCNWRYARAPSVNIELTIGYIAADISIVIHNCDFNFHATSYYSMRGSINGF